MSERMRALEDHTMATCKECDHYGKCNEWARLAYDVIEGLAAALKEAEREREWNRDMWIAERIVKEAAEAQLTRVRDVVQAWSLSSSVEIRNLLVEIERALAEPAAGAPTLASELGRLGSSGYLPSAPNG